MSADWRDQVRGATQKAPRGSKERVWRRLANPAARRPQRWVWAFAPALAAAALVVFLVSRGGVETKVIRTDSSVISLISARATFSPDRREVTLHQGTLEASVWGEPGLTILARGTTVRVESAVVMVRVAAETVEVSPIRGWIALDGKRVMAPAARGPKAGVEALEPPDVALRRARRLVALAMDSSGWEEAARTLGEAAQSGTLGAEAALLEKGELELRKLRTPDRALQTFLRAEADYPDGNLAQERDLSALEALVSLARWPEVQARAERFMAANPGSERQSEVRRALAAALLHLGQRERACKLLQSLPAAEAGDVAEACGAGQ